MYNVIRHLLMNLSQSTDRRTHFCTSERVKNNKNFEVTFVLSNCLSAVVGGVAAKNHGNLLHAMEKSVHYISKVKNVRFHTAWRKWF